MDNTKGDDNAVLPEQLTYAGEYEYEDEDVESDEHETLRGPKSESSLHIRLEKSMFDYLSKDVDEESYEEEDVVSDLFATKYDPTEYRAMNLIDRQEMISILKDLQPEIRILVIKNKFLHRKYTNYIKPSSWFATAVDKFDEATIFEDDRYFALLEKFEQTRDDMENRRKNLQMDLQTLKDNYQIANSNFEQAFEALMERELTVGRKIKPRKIGKQVWQAEVDHLLTNQRRRVKDVAKIRLSFVRLYYQLEKLQVSLEKCDNLGRGYSMMDYEYMLKKKEVYTEKSEEQKEHMKRIGDKNYSNAAIVRHIAEETDLYKKKIREALSALVRVTEESAVEHSKAVELLKQRAMIFKNIMKLREEIGLLESPYLLVKMEAAVNEIAKYKKRNENLKSKLRADDEKMRYLLRQ